MSALEKKLGITWTGLCLVAFIAASAGLAYADSRVIADQGKPGNQGPWPVTVSGGAGGAVSVTPAVCGSPTHKITSVGVAAAVTPAAQLPSRRFITFCVSLENSGNPTVKCRIDGTNPVLGNTNVGDVLGVGDCITYPIPAGVTPKCIADAAATAFTSLECT